MHIQGKRWWQGVGLSLGIIACLGQASAWAIFLDKEETLRFNGRVYNRTALATQEAAANTRLQTPYNSWTMLQNRTFMQMELRQNLTDLVAGRYTGLLAPLQYPLAPLRRSSATVLPESSPSYRRQQPPDAVPSTTSVEREGDY